MAFATETAAFLLPTASVLRGEHGHRIRPHGTASKCNQAPAMNYAAPPLSMKVTAARRKPGTRTPSFRKMQERQNKGPRTFRQKAEREKEEAIQAEAAKAVAAEAKLEMKRARKARRQDATPLAKLKIGQEMKGVVHNLVRHGAYVDIGAKRDGLVHVRDMSVEFVHSPEDLVREGDEVTVWVKYVNTVSNVLGLSMRRPLSDAEPQKRTTVADLEVGKRYEGHVARLTNYGAYVDIGAERHGFLHVSCMWGRRPRETLDEMRLGRPIWVIVEDVDEIRSYIKLNARGKSNVPLDAEGKVPAEEMKEFSLPEPVQQKIVLARPGEEIPDDEEEHLSEVDSGMMLAKENGRDEHLVDQVGPVAQTASWDEIRHMFDDGTEFIGMEDK